MLLEASHWPMTMYPFRREGAHAAQQLWSHWLPVLLLSTDQLIRKEKRLVLAISKPQRARSHLSGMLFNVTRLHNTPGLARHHCDVAAGVEPVVVTPLTWGFSPVQWLYS